MKEITEFLFCTFNTHTDISFPQAPIRQIVMYIQRCTVVRPPFMRILSPSQRYYYVRRSNHLTGNTHLPLCYMLGPKLFLQPQSVPNKELPILVELHARYSNIFLPSKLMPHREHSNNDNHGKEVWLTSNKSVTPIIPRNRNSVAQLRSRGPILITFAQNISLKNYQTPVAVAWSVMDSRDRYRQTDRQTDTFLIIQIY